MLKGKIVSDDSDYYVVHYVKVGTVMVDITEGVRELIAQERAKHAPERSKHAQEITALRAQHADTVDRYNQIARIILAGGAGMPTG